MARINISENPNGQGTDSDDTINDTSGSRRTFGFAGNDSIYGFGGDDEIFGNLGRDYLSGGEGTDYLYGGQGADNIDGDLDNDFVFGNLGEDSLSGGGGDDQIFGGRDNDRIFGDSGADFLSGDLGFDILTGGFGRDTFVVQNELATNSLDFIEDFVPGEDKIALAGGLAFSDIEILTVNGAGADRNFLNRQFAPWSVPGFDGIINNDLVIRLKSTGRIIALVDAFSFNSSNALTPSSLSATDFISV